MSKWSHVQWSEVITPEKSDYQIAKEIGCSNTLVGTHRQRLGVAPYKGSRIVVRGRQDQEDQVKSTAFRIMFRVSGDLFGALRDGRIESIKSALAGLASVVSIDVQALSDDALAERVAKHLGGE